MEKPLYTISNFMPLLADRICVADIVCCWRTAEYADAAVPDELATKVTGTSIIFNSGSVV
jgi:hypothetical protein